MMWLPVVGVAIGALVGLRIKWPHRHDPPPERYPYQPYLPLGIATEQPHPDDER